MNTLEECFQAKWVSGYSSFEDVAAIAASINPSTVDSRTRALVKLLSQTNLRSGKLLSVGCGVGLHRKAFGVLSVNLDYWGCDPISSDIEIARKLYNENDRFKVMSGEDLSYSGREFDVVVFEGSLQYIAKYRDALSEGLRVSKSWAVIHNVSVVHDHENLFFQRDVGRGGVLPEINFNEAELIDTCVGLGAVVTAVATLDARCVSGGFILFQKSYLLQRLG